MADFDDDILALAGFESARESSPARSSPRPASDGERRQPKRTSRGRESPLSPRRSVELSEEGEASSPGSPAHSLGSGAMDESQSSRASSEAGSLASDEYPLEGLFRNAKDKAHIMSLPELQREQIISDRAETVAQKRKNAELRQALAAKQRDAAREATRSRKRKADSEADTTPRKTSKSKSKASEALEELRHNRQAKDPRARTRAGRGSYSYSSSRGGSVASDRDADGESDYEPAAPKLRPGQELGDFNDYSRLRIARGYIIKVMFYPDYEKELAGCYVRVPCGFDRATKENLYEIAQIHDITEMSASSMLTDERNRTFKVNRGIVAKVGKTSKTIPFSTISNASFTQAEFESYKSRMNDDGVALASRDWLQRKALDLNAFINRSWSSQDITWKMEQQDKYLYTSAAATSTPTFSTTSGQAHSAERHRVQNDILSAASERNRRQNEDRIRKIQMEERRAQKRRLVEAAKKREEAKNGVGAAPEVKPLPVLSPTVEKKISVYKPKKNPFELTQRKTEDEIIAEMDFEIDPDLKI